MDEYALLTHLVKKNDVKGLVDVIESLRAEVDELTDDKFLLEAENAACEEENRKLKEQVKHLDAQVGRLRLQAVRRKRRNRRPRY